MKTKKLVSRIIIDGINGVGKSTVAMKLARYFQSEYYAPYSNRNDIYDLWFVDPFEAKEKSLEILRGLPNVGVFDRFHLTPQAMINHPLEFVKLISQNDLTVVLDAEIDTIKYRLSKRDQVEDIDADGRYQPHMRRLADDWNAMHIATDSLSENDVFELIIDKYDSLIRNKIYKIREGRSKEVYRNGTNLLIKLKPSLDSYTYGKSRNVDGTEELRNSFIEKFVQVCKDNSVNIMDYVKVDTKSYSTDFNYSMPFEVIVKSRAVGTTIVDCPGLFDKDMPFLTPIVRFDYRLDPNDPTIPSDYIENYGIDTTFLRNNSLKAFEALSNYLLRKGYELIDLCFVYGFSHDGKLKIISEISPDGMRIRKEGKSYIVS